ncbi:BRO family protein [Prescottella equi]|uniref:BRO family protein n=1 Tax=Rhodococcus hoagii TaxID=43767 RepID=UPI00197E75A7|nr:BRO family protein [Prescottella equi]NKS67303.1 hypothetical protein [Prescottella equi]NKU91724.1 hypothetical protein [Prescottella equi]NKU95773.1 hypothetical protein [Prescottella equi]NKU95790.1 hypothetical protein [Prescottella equi]
MSEMVPFAYGDAQVRVVTIDGEPWFVLSDLCKVLDIANPSNVAARLDEGVRQTHTLRHAEGMRGNPNVTIVSEPGMYEVVIRSDKPEAARFRRWITAEVLPAIRKTGSYGQPALSGPELMARALIEAQQTLAAKDATIAVLTPKAAYVDTYVADTDLLSFATVASSHDLKESQLRQILIDAGWIYAEEESRWSDSKGRKEVRRRYSEYAHKKPYFRRLEVHEAPRFRGEVMHTLKVTAPGAEAIGRNLPRWTEGAA